jgi:hypothetical protein
VVGENWINHIHIEIESAKKVTDVTGVNTGFFKPYMDAITWLHMGRDFCMELFESINRILNGKRGG